MKRAARLGWDEGLFGSLLAGTGAAEHHGAKKGATHEPRSWATPAPGYQLSGTASRVWRRAQEGRGKEEFPRMPRSSCCRYLPHFRGPGGSLQGRGLLRKQMCTLQRKPTISARGNQPRPSFIKVAPSQGPPGMH